MATARFIKRHIRSVANTRQITRAMEAVSATKMRRSQEYALGARPYAREALRLLANLVRFHDGAAHAYFHVRPKGKNLIFLVTSDKGLCGGLNSNVLRKGESLFAEAEYDVVAVGKKGADQLVRRGIQPIFVYKGFGDYFHLHETQPLAEFLLSLFKKRIYRRVWMVYTSFRTTLRQSAVMRQLLPVKRTSLEEIIRDIVPEHGRYADEGIARGMPETAFEYLFEPSPDELLASLVPILVTTALHHAILEANASEHSARMVAMKNASENAADILKDLELEYNKARQAGITREIAEVTTGANAQ